MRSCTVLVTVLWLAAFTTHGHGQEPPKFTEGPSARTADAAVSVTFTVDRLTDVAVAVVNEKSEVVRHLAAGRLGKNVPAPLQSDSLSQRLLWDRTDDRGRRVPDGAYRVRVGLRLRASFDKALGWNPRTVGEIKALAVDGAGNLYCLNGYSVPGLVVFNREGEYARTLLPHDAAKAPGIRTLTRADGQRVPFLVNMRDPYPFAQIGISGLRASGSMVVTPDGVVVIAGPKRHQAVVLRADGSIPRPLLSRSVLSSLAGGVHGLATSPDGTHLYVSGTLRFSGVRRKPVPAICRVPWGEEPGKPELLVQGSAEPKSILGSAGDLATDADGNVYACDRANDCVAVFDPRGNALGTIPAPDARQVAVHPKAGAVYAAARLSLKKFGSRNAGQPVWTLPLPKVPGNTPPVMALDASGERPVLWVGCPQQRNYSKYVLWRIEDLGPKPGKPAEFADRGAKGLYSPVHIAVDPVRDEVYVREWRESWRGQWFRRIDGVTGKMTKLPIRGNEMAIGPNGLLYCRGFHGGSVGSWIARYDHSGKYVPFKNVTNPPQAPKREGLWVLGSYRGATGVGMKGFDVAPNGDLYVLRYFSARGGKGLWVKKGFKFPELPAGVEHLTPLIDVYRPEGELKRSGVVRYFPQGACGVRVDRAGNVYVSEHLTPRGCYYSGALAEQLPAPRGTGNKIFEWKDGGLNWYLFNTGSLFKFPPGGGRIRPAKATDPGAQFAGTRGKLTRHMTVEGALWQHFGIAPSPADTNRGHNGGCVCTNNRFDLDAYGRAFLPDVHRFCVDVLDANGNYVTSFGRYGNADDTEPGIPLNWGSFVGWSPKAVYVCDNLNRRIVRVTLGHAAEKTCPVR
jgi:DNA-binding beta-propeller fold protein YncE